MTKGRQRDLRSNRDRMFSEPASLEVLTRRIGSDQSDSGTNIRDKTNFWNIPETER